MVRSASLFRHLLQQVPRNMFAYFVKWSNSEWHTIWTSGATADAHSRAAGNSGRGRGKQPGLQFRHVRRASRYKRRAAMTTLSCLGQQ